MRSERKFKIYIPKSEQPLSHLSILKMLMFSDKITIVVSQNELKVLKANLDKLYDHLLWSLYHLKYEQGYNQTKFKFELCHQVLAFIFSCIDLTYQTQFSNLIDGKLEHFFKFLEHIKSFEMINLNNIDFNQHTDRKQYIKFSESDKLQKYQNYEFIMNQIRESLKEIKFTDCQFLGRLNSLFPLLYPSIERLYFKSVRFDKNALFGEYKNLMELKFIHCQTYEYQDQMENSQKYKLRNEGATFDIIFRFITNKAQTKPINVVSADVFFENSLQLAYPWPYLMQTYNISFRDTQTVFTFSMVHTLLSFTAHIEGAAKLPPIYLGVTNFKSEARFISKKINQMDKLKILAQISELRVVYIKTGQFKNRMFYNMRLKLSSGQSRIMILTLDVSQGQIHI
ncbi:hypothetical protein FGO68_gene7036 [Halteria grandinella]|uniref:Uncharacterized protein n=1 Tax=Halteria grandinella TaxID=5974 RepID=A0A8J8NDC0_HALGN|nr:hypothetical protein FGO68_gene7036 [Halteria grandinella]